MTTRITYTQSEHEVFVNNLCNALKGSFDYVEANKEISTFNSNILEIDVFALRGDDVYLFEVKCSHRISKATKLLRRAKKYFSEYDTVKLLFYNGSANKLVELH